MWTLFELKVLLKIYRNFPEIYDPTHKDSKNAEKKRKSLTKIAETMSLFRYGTTEEHILDVMDTYRWKFRTNRLDKDYFKLINNITNRNYVSWHEEAWLYKGFYYIFDAERIPGDAPAVYTDFKQFMYIHQDNLGRIIILHRSKDRFLDINCPGEELVDREPNCRPIKPRKGNLNTIARLQPSPKKEINETNEKQEQTAVEQISELIDPLAAKKNENLAKWKVLHKVINDVLVTKDNLKYSSVEQPTEQFLQIMNLHKSLLDEKERELYGTLLDTKLIKDFRKAKTTEQMYVALKKVFHWILEDIKNAKDFEERELADMTCVICQENIQEQNEVVKDDILYVDIELSKCCDCGVCIDNRGFPIDCDSVRGYVEPVVDNSTQSKTIPQNLIAGEIDPQVISQIRDIVQRIQYPDSQKNIPDSNTTNVLTKTQKKNKKRREQRRHKIDSNLLVRIRTVLEDFEEQKAQLVTSELPQNMNTYPAGPRNSEIEERLKGGTADISIQGSVYYESNQETPGSVCDLVKEDVDSLLIENQIVSSTEAVFSHDDQIEEEISGETGEEIYEETDEETYEETDEETYEGTYEESDEEIEHEANQEIEVDFEPEKEQITEHETKQELNDDTHIINDSQVVTDVNVYGSLKAKLKEVIKSLLKPIPTNTELLNNCQLIDLPKSPSTKTDRRILFQRVTRSQAKKNWRIEILEESDDESDEEHNYSLGSSAYSTTDDSIFLSTDDDSTDCESEDSLYMQFRDSLAQMESSKLGERNVNYHLDIGVQSQIDQVKVVESGCHFNTINAEDFQKKVGDVLEEPKYKPYANYFKETLHQKITAAAHKVSSTTKFSVLINKEDKEDILQETMSEVLSYFFNKVISLAFFNTHLRICKKCGNYGPCYADRMCPQDPKYSEQTFNFTYDVTSHSSNSDVTTTYQIIDNSSQNGDIFEPEEGKLESHNMNQTPLVIWDNESWESFREDIGDVLKVMRRFKTCETCGKCDTCYSKCQNILETKRNNGEPQFRQQKSIEIQTNLDQQETKSVAKADMCEPTMFQPLVTWDIGTWESFRDDINEALKAVSGFKRCEKCGKFETCKGRCDSTKGSSCSEEKNYESEQNCIYVDNSQKTMIIKSVANSTSTEDANVMDLCDKCGAFDTNFCEKTCLNDQKSEENKTASAQADDFSQNQFNDTQFDQGASNNETAKMNQIWTNTTTQCDQNCQEQFKKFQANCQPSNQAYNFNNVCQFHQFQYFKLFQSNETNVVSDQADLKSKSNEEIKLWFRLFVKRFTSIEDPKVVLQVQRDVDNVVYDALLK